ncbi:unnamed protein product [marine sediment metagenome]|uniref:YopX protein domain-containing protein n=1 Tax=marine sediment metagenome TaxID=412755 RepID=X1BD17_9ZZZZ
MRQIKFRAWDKKDKKMRIVTRITFGLEPTGHPPIIVHLDDGKEPVTRSVNDVILLQYTGLKDKDGKEIYEGHIVHFLNHNTGEFLKREVKWNETFMGWDIYTVRNYVENTPTSKDAGIEIIGNIYENPELLKSLVND